MQELHNLFWAMARHDCNSADWHRGAGAVLAAIVDWLEPTDPRAEAADAQGDVRGTYAEPHRCATCGTDIGDVQQWVPKARHCSQACQDEAADANYWLAECEQHWRRANTEESQNRGGPWCWAEEWADRLIAAAKEAGKLRAELTKRAKSKPRTKHAKGPRSKPNELRARIKREARLVAEGWDKDTLTCYLGLELDGIRAFGYAYCMPNDDFSRLFGASLARDRAIEALESALNQPTAIYDELISERGAATLWEWERGELP